MNLTVIFHERNPTKQIYKHTIVWNNRGKSYKSPRKFPETILYTYFLLPACISPSIRIFLRIFSRFREGEGISRLITEKLAAFSAHPTSPSWIKIVSPPNSSKLGKIFLPTFCVAKNILPRRETSLKDNLLVSSLCLVPFSLSLSPVRDFFLELHCKPRRPWTIVSKEIEAASRENLPPPFIYSTFPLPSPFSPHIQEGKNLFPFSPHASKNRTSREG